MRSPTSLGIVPESELSYRCNDLINARPPISLGSVPVSPFAKSQRATEEARSGNKVGLKQ